VDLPADVGLFGLGRLRKELADILQAEVDLVPASGLKQGVRTDVENEQVPL
jgi:predicted nucleotidyltransferase